MFPEELVEFFGLFVTVMIEEDSGLVFGFSVELGFESCWSWWVSP